MKIKIDRLKEGNNVIAFGKDEVTAVKTNDYKILSGTELVLSVSKNNRYLHIAGSNTVVIRENCDRCCEEYESTIELEIDYVFHLGDEKRGNSGNLEIVRVEENDGYLVLDSYYLETFYLTLPLKRLCSENCKGLCAKCGTNLNTGSCNCNEEETIDPRWEKLARLAKKQKN